MIILQAPAILLLLPTFIDIFATTVCAIHTRCVLEAAVN